MCVVQQSSRGDGDAVREGLQIRRFSVTRRREDQRHGPRLDETTYILDTVEVSTVLD